MSHDHTPVAVVLFTCIRNWAYKHCHLSYTVVLSVTLRLNIAWVIFVIPAVCSATSMSVSLHIPHSPSFPQRKTIKKQ